MPGLLAAQQPAQQAPPPTSYLDQAQSVLKAMPSGVPHDASKPLDELRKHFDALNKAYRAQQDQIGPPLTRQDPEKDVSTWRDNFSDVERDLAVLIGGGSTVGDTTIAEGKTVVTPVTATPRVVATTGTNGQTAPATAGTSGQMPATPATPATNPTGAPTTPTGADAAAAAAAGTPLPASGASSASAQPAPGAQAPSAPVTQVSTTGTMATSLAASKVSLIGVRDINPQVRSALENFRLQLELFYSSTMGNLE